MVGAFSAGPIADRYGRRVGQCRISRRVRRSFTPPALTLDSLHLFLPLRNVLWRLRHHSWFYHHLVQLQDASTRRWTIRSRLGNLVSLTFPSSLYIFEANSLFSLVS